MPWLCDLALAAGLSLGGSCQPATVQTDPLPANDPAVWAYKPLPPPSEEKPAAPPPAPPFPPVVIEKKVYIQAPPPAEPAPAPPVVTGPDPATLAMQAAYRQRAASSMAAPDIVVPASLPNWGNTAAAPGGLAGSRLKAPPMPLDLAAVINSPGAAKYQEKEITSGQPVDNSRIVTTDRYINGILETGINTQLDGAAGGPVVIQTTRDVFGYHGRNLLIPKGSRLVCAFKTLEKVGSSRAPLRCTRLLLGGSRAEIFGMKANITDVQGALGVSGEVDNRFMERYGTAFILTGISAAVRAASASSTTNESLATQSNALTTGGEEMSQRFGEITAATLEQMINLTPILKVAQGTRVVVRPDTDWYIANVSAETAE